MMLNNISIENFKCFEDESVDFKPLTIITGANSSGKSSLIQAILLLSEHKDLELTRYLHSLGSFDDLKNKYVNPSHYLLKATFNNSITSQLVASKGSEIIDKIADYPLVFPNNATYLSANRQTFSEIQNLIPNTKDERKFGIAGEYIASYYDNFKDEPIAEYLRKQKAVSYTLEGQLSYWLAKITNINYKLHTETVSSSSVKVFYKDSDGLFFKPSNIGTGVSFLSTIIIACLSAQKGNVIIIENPEVHLHPQSQSRLAEFFAFIASKGVQIIIETHNDHLINRIRYEVFKENISSQDVIIHYKYPQQSFKTIEISPAGMFVDEQGWNSFPEGFYDATLQEVFEINQGK